MNFLLIFTLLFLHPKEPIKCDSFHSFKNTGDSVTLIIYRPKRYVGSGYKVKIDLKSKIFYIKNNSVTTSKVKPGNYSVRNLTRPSVKNRMIKDFLFEEGKTYYLKYQISDALLGGEDYFELIDEEKAVKEIEKIKKK